MGEQRKRFILINKRAVCTAVIRNNNLKGNIRQRPELRIMQLPGDELDDIFLQIVDFFFVQIEKHADVFNLDCRSTFVHIVILRYAG